MALLRVLPGGRVGSSDPLSHNAALAKQWRRAAYELVADLEDSRRRRVLLRRIPDMDLDDLQNLVIELGIERRRNVERGLMQPGDGAA